MFEKRSFKHMSDAEFAECLVRVASTNRIIEKLCAGVKRDSVGVFVAGLIDEDVKRFPRRESAAEFLKA